jgi:hypothetical protein
MRRSLGIYEPICNFALNYGMSTSLFARTTYRHPTAPIRIGGSHFPIAKVTVGFKPGTWPWQALCQTPTYLSASK